MWPATGLDQYLDAMTEGEHTVSSKSCSDLSLPQHLNKCIVWRDGVVRSGLYGTATHKARISDSRADESNGLSRLSIKRQHPLLILQQYHGIACKLPADGTFVFGIALFF